MDWTLQCCLWIIFIWATTSAYRQQHTGYVDSPYGYTPSLNRRHDTHTNHGGFNHERLYARSAESEQSSSQDDRPSQSQRMNERSIAVTSNIQRVNHQERKRLQTREDDRGESGSFKVVNKYPLTSRRGAIEDRVVFPGETSDTTRVQTRQSPVSVLDNLPEECKELGICDILPDEDAYNQIVRPALEKCGAADRSIDELDKPEIAQRTGFDTMDLCSFQERVMMPKAGQDKDDKWHIVLNRNNDPIQGYRVEICRQSRSNCTPGVINFYKGYSGYCKQKYAYRPMIAVDPATNSTYTVALRVPSCCSCVAQQT